MVFNFLESGIALFDDTFNTIKSLFTVAVENMTPTSLTKVGLGYSGIAFYIRWWDSDTTYYSLILQPTAQNASNKAYMSYYDGSTTTRLFTFNVS